MEVEHLMEEWEITERRGGAIFKTKPTGRMVWRTMKQPRQEGNFCYATLSTKQLRDMKTSEYMRIRQTT